MMKKKIVSLIICLIVFSQMIPLAAVVAAAKDKPFKDVPDGIWYASAADWCRKKGYMTGTSDTTFSPDVQLTRAMFVQILAKLSGVNLGKYKYSGKFKDVKSGDWYAQSVEWAIEKKITGGTGANTFSPNEPVTREQMAVFILAFAVSKGYDTSSSGSVDKFSDKDQISSWALNAVKWAVSEGMLTGTAAKYLSPKATATRAQTAVVVKRFMEVFVAKQK